MEVSSTNTKNVCDLAKILKQLFPAKLFKSIKHGSGSWVPQLLAMTALLGMICGEATIVIAFQSAFDMLRAALGNNIQKNKASYQGFTGQLAKYQSQLMKVILPHLRNLTKSKLSAFWKIGR